jgi:protein ImuB
MARRLLCLYFPGISIDRLQREDPARGMRPFAVTREEKGHLYIAATNRLARESGIVTGARLADALTILPNLEAVPDDAESNARVKHRLIEWCHRYSPLVGDDDFGGIALDITGCAHLFGGEAALLADIQARIRSTGYRIRGSIADSRGAAWALARYAKRVIVTGEDLPGALDDLPVEALRLPEETTRELRRVGLAKVSTVRKISRQSLAIRYGPTILLRLDQAFCHAEEPIIPYDLPAPYRAGRILGEPIGTVGAVEYVLLDLLKEICSCLEKDHIGARQLHLDCYRVDGTVVRCCIGTSKPVRSVTRLRKLFSEKLGRVDAGFGIETLVLSVSSFEKSDPTQLGFPQVNQDWVENEESDDFIDRLGGRLGFQNVCRFRICESLLPEYAVELQPVTTPIVSSATWPENRLRPVCMLNPPVRIEVLTVLPDELPVQFRMGSQLHRIAKTEGPERLTPEWWRDLSVSWESRDYYRVEDEGGCRFWIFRESKSDPSYSRWFLCGQLP